MTDSEAVQAAQRGDQRGFESLVKRYELRALRVAFQVTRDREAAKDIVADAFVAVFERIGSFDRNRPFEPWLLRIVINRAVSLIRRANRYQKLLALLGGRSESPDPEAEAVRNEMQSVLAQAINSLPPHERAALSLRYFLDLDDRGIAESLGCPVGTVKTRLHRGRARLRKELEADGRGLWTNYATEVNSGGSID